MEPRGGGRASHFLDKEIQDTRGSDIMYDLCDKVFSMYIFIQFYFIS